MARSVSVPFNAQRVLYVDLTDIIDDHTVTEALEGVTTAICKRYPSLQPNRYWYGREDLALAENDRAVVGISEY